MITLPDRFGTGGGQLDWTSSIYQIREIVHEIERGNFTSELKLARWQPPASPISASAATSPTTIPARYTPSLSTAR
ncbi:MAG: hypothetical protein ACLQU2_22145 [Candidatus Binataceae bacterium]